MSGHLGAAARTADPASSEAIIDELFDALTRGDIEAACDCCTSDVVVWRCHDCRPTSLEAMGGAWKDFVANFPERRFVDVRRRAMGGGFVQQHLMVARSRSGVRLAWPACVIVTVRDGRIARLEEYIDRTGHFTVRDDQDLRTPGLANQRFSGEAATVSGRR
jgi:ketosteroid isomerase-like protein